MPTMHPSAEPLVPDKIPSQESPLSPEWTHAITTLMGHPLSSEPGKHIKNWILYHIIHKYTMFGLKWNPTQFKLDIYLQMYQETEGSLAYLKDHTVRKLVSLMKYMSLLIRQDRPNAHKHNLLYFISGNQLFRLTAHDMKSALINEKLENHGSQKYSSKRVKVVNPKPTDTTCKVPTDIHTSGTNPNDTPLTVPTTTQISVIKKGIKPDELPQFMAQHNCEDQEPTDDPSTVPTTSQASCDHTLKPKCAHNPLVTQCNQSQYLTLMKNNGVHSSSASQASQTNLSNSLVSHYTPDHGEHVLKRSATSTGEQDIPVQWFKFIHLSPKPRMTKTPFQIVVQMAYSPIASMNYKWTINLHDGYPLFQVMTQEGYITPPLHILKHDLSSLAPPKGEMKSSFSWTSLFKSPTSSTLCFGEPTLGKLNQIKLLCSISSSTLWDPTLAKLNQEIKLCIHLCDSSVHTGTPFSVPSSSSETNRVSDRHSSLVTASSSRVILGKAKNEVTKVLTHQIGKNEEYFHGASWHNTTKNGENSD